MHKKVMLLEELQQLDLKIDGCNGEKAQLFEQISAGEARLEEVKVVVAAKEEAMAALLAAKAELDANLVTENDNIRRSEARLREIKTQKEYQAVSREITAAKKLKGELEEQIAQKAAQIDELRGEIAAARENLTALEENSAGQKKEAEAQLARIDADIAAIHAEREAAEKEIPAPLMNRYRMLREKRQGLAVVEAREGSCLGCNMNLPPQLYNNLLKVSDLITCPHCQRVLFVRQ